MRRKSILRNVHPQFEATYSHPKSNKTQPKRQCHPPSPNNEVVYSFEAPIRFRNLSQSMLYVTSSAVALEAWLIPPSEVAGTINSSGAFSSTNFLSLTCSLALSAVQTLSSNFPRF
jgi:hypothetical protein